MPQLIALIAAACTNFAGTYMCGQSTWTFTPQGCEKLAWDVRAQNPDGDYENRHTDYFTDGVRRKIGEKTTNGHHSVSYLALAYQQDQLIWSFDTEVTQTCAGCDPTPTTSSDSYTFGLTHERDLAVHVESANGQGADLLCGRVN